jgi:FkbM family methyltransferase
LAQEVRIKTMIYDRHFVEMKGKFGAGIVDETDEWYQVKVMNKALMYTRKADKSVTPALTNEGFWEAWVTSWFLNELEQGYDDFIDLGANSGYYSVLARAHQPLTHVIAIEANPRYSQMLRVNAAWNEFRVIAKAVSDKPGRVTLIVPGELEGSGSIVPHDFSAYDTDTYDVTAVTMDDLVKDEAVIGKVLIKIDVEGAEQHVWRGMQETLATIKPVVLLEYTPNAYDDNFLDELESYGDLMWVNYSGREEAISRDEILAQTDWIMLVVRPRG